jgi:predicted RNA-binding protein YlqC (UPF0109 family)
VNDYAGLVEYIVKNIVDHPDAVVIESHPGRGRSQTIEISLDAEDVGRVIGKSGRNIEAIRAVVKAAAIKDHERVNVEVLADELPPDARATENDLGEEAPAGEEERAADEPAVGEESAVGEDSTVGEDSAVGPDHPASETLQ